MDLRILIDSLTDWWENNNEKVGNCKSFYFFFILMKILLNFKLILKRMLEIELKTNILVKKSKLIKDILTDF